MRILSGVQPSGKLHLGNYLGAIRQFVALQDEGEALYFIADWHALTTVRDGARLDALSVDVALDFLALGLDPARAVLFRQSHVPEHAELAWLLATLTPMGLLERAHAYKDKLARGQQPELGLFSYPVLMAADILLYSADVVPVGQDQKQHLEIARDVAIKFNRTYAERYDEQNPHAKADPALAQLTLPEPRIMASAATLPGLDGQKMSKSADNTLELFMAEGPLKKRIMGMPTDSTPVEAPKPPDSPLLALLLALAPPDEAQRIETSWREGGVGYGSYKKQLLALFLDEFGAARQKRAQLADHPDEVERVLKDGALRAREVAAPLWRAIVRRVGCGRVR